MQAGPVKGSRSHVSKGIAHWPDLTYPSALWHAVPHNPSESGTGEIARTFQHPSPAEGRADQKERGEEYDCQRIRATALQPMGTA